MDLHINLATTGFYFKLIDLFTRIYLLVKLVIVNISMIFAYIKKGGGNYYPHCACRMYNIKNRGVEGAYTEPHSEAHKRGTSRIGRRGERERQREEWGGEEQGQGERGNGVKILDKGEIGGWI